MSNRPSIQVKSFQKEVILQGGRRSIWPDSDKDRVKISLPGGLQTVSSCGSVQVSHLNRRIDALYKMYKDEKEGHRATKQALDKAIDLAVQLLSEIKKLESRTGLTPQKSTSGSYQDLHRSGGLAAGVSVLSFHQPTHQIFQSIENLTNPSSSSYSNLLHRTDSRNQVIIPKKHSMKDDLRDLENLTLALKNRKCSGGS